jgi:hypothetical protein
VREGECPRQARSGGGVDTEGLREMAEERKRQEAHHFLASVRFHVNTLVHGQELAGQ